MMTVRIDAERLLRSLEAMGEIGVRPGGAGRTRLALDDGDRLSAPAQAADAVSGAPMLYGLPARVMQP